MRDMGFIAWQVALILDHLQQENWNATKDAVSLLFVTLEQAALDGGRMEVGLLLSLTEDPPQSLFTARTLAAGVKPRAFAPTAEQKWITIALQYLKELDAIAVRRTEATSQKQPTQAPPVSNQKKKKGKGGGKGRQQQEEEDQEQAL